MIDAAGNSKPGWTRLGTTQDSGRWHWMGLKSLPIQIILEFQRVFFIFLLPGILNFSSGRKRCCCEFNVSLGDF